MPGTHGPTCGCQHEEELIGAPFLLSSIDKEGIRCLNETVVGSCKTVFKAFDNRLDDDYCVSQEGDPEMIFHVPFLSPCRISGLHVIGGENGVYPKSVKIYKDSDNLDFASVEETESVQEISLIEDFHGMTEYPLKVSKLQNVNSLALYFPMSGNGDQTQIYYIGLRGEASNVKRQPVITVYEARPNPADHQITEKMPAAAN